MDTATAYCQAEGGKHLAGEGPEVGGICLPAIMSMKLFLIMASGSSIFHVSPHDCCGEG